MRYKYNELEGVMARNVIVMVLKHLPGIHNQQKHSGRNEPRTIKPIQAFDGALIGKEVYRGRSLWTEGDTVVYEITAVDGRKDIEKALDKGTNPLTNEVASKFIYSMSKKKLYGTTTGIHADLTAAIGDRTGNSVHFTYSDGKFEASTEYAGQGLREPYYGGVAQRQYQNTSLDNIHEACQYMQSIGFPSYMKLRVLSASSADAIYDGFFKSRVK